MLEDLKNQFDFFLRNKFKFSRKNFVEKSKVLIERNIQENLYTKDILERYFEKRNAQNIKALDIGCKNWFYAKGEHDFFDSFSNNFSLDGVEIDAYRLYTNFYNRYEVAKYYTKGLKNTKYIADNLLNINEKSPYYGDIKILNPLSNYFELMRPTMAYNLIQTAVSNLALGKNDIKIFELGKTFKRYTGHADSYDDYTEKNMFGALLTGVKYQKGFGASKEIKYSVYDAVAAVRSVFEEYNILIEIKNNDSLGMFEPGVGAEILVGGKHIGVVGKISKKVLLAFENGKLAKDDVFYFEFCYEALTETKKSISYETSFPSVVREYNFIVKNGIHFTDYVSLIPDASPLVINAKPIDVYFGTGVEKGSSAVLINVEYNAKNRTLSAEEIEAVEESFKKALADKFGIELKK